MIQDTNGPAVSYSGGGSGTTLLDIDYLTQLPFNGLCWAACTAMLLNANGKGPVGVTDVASRITGRVCDGDPSSAPCNQGEDPGDVLTHAPLNFSEPSPQGPIFDHNITDQIVNGHQPIEVFWQYLADASSGHVALIVGYDETSGTWCVFDPLVGPSWQDYEYFAHYGGTANWTRTYYAIGGALGTHSTTG
jgi:hypothetical protein